VRVFKNILIAVALLAGAMALSILLNALNPPKPGDSGYTEPVVWLMIVATSLWASIRSYRLEFRSYKTGLAYHPVTLFIAHCMLWLVVFPWFLTVQDKILDGTAELKMDGTAGLKNEFKPAISPAQATAQPNSGSPVSPVTRTPEEVETSISPVDPDRVPPPLPSADPKQTIPAPATLLLPPPLPKRQTQPEPDRLAQLQKLADFKAQGILSDEEFQAEKRRLLG